MATPEELRRLRLKNDYKSMQNIKGSIVQWRPLRGQPPYVESYELTVNVRTIISSRPDYRDTHVLKVTLQPGYPSTAPRIVMETNPAPYHPNWFASDRRWCYGTWELSEGLGEHIIRMIRTLQFHPDITNPASPANSSAKEWYLAHQRSGWFPCDRQVLPDPTQDRFKFNPIPTPAPTKKTFQIRG